MKIFVGITICLFATLAQAAENDESGWGDKAVRCPKEFQACLASGKAKKECVAGFLNCLMAKNDVVYDMPELEDESGWGDKAVRCPKEFQACFASGKAKKECVAGFLNCLMAKNDEVYDVQSNPITCFACEHSLGIMSKFLKKDSVRQKITAAAKKGCKVLPDAEVSGCEMMVENYAGQALDWLSDARNLCAALKMCSPKYQNMFLEMGAAGAEMAIWDKVECFMCEQVADIVSRLINDKLVVKRLVHLMEKVCDGLGTGKQFMCTMFVDNYGKKAIDWLEQHAQNASQICETELKMCKPADEELTSAADEAVFAEDQPGQKCRDEMHKCQYVDHKPFRTCLTYELVCLFGDPTTWGPKAKKCTMEFASCVHSGQDVKSCSDEFINCLMAKNDVVYDMPELEDESGWGDKAVRCPKEFQACLASGKAKKECVAGFLNCLMAKNDVVYDMPELEDESGWGDKAVHCFKEFHSCLASGQAKKDCVARFKFCRDFYPDLEDESGWGDKSVRCPKEFQACLASGKAKKECVAGFLNCLMAKNDVVYDMPELEDESGWGDKAVRCPKEFQACLASGKAKKECVAGFLNCLMAKNDEPIVQASPVMQDGLIARTKMCTSKFARCIASGSIKKRTCTLWYAMCMAGSEED